MGKVAALTYVDELLLVVVGSEDYDEFMRCVHVVGSLSRLIDFVLTECFALNLERQCMPG